MSSSFSSSTRSLSSVSRSTRKVRRFELSEILSATDNFNSSRIIRKGEFGNTYKGILQDGLIVAVKRLDTESNVVEEFRNESDILRKNKNDKYLVSLIGICDESHEMMIVHEFMQNGTLADHLSDKNSRLTWEILVKICLDVAKALEFLHSETAHTSRIIHRNLNPENIWLDENWAAKISDFEYAKIAPANATQSAISTNVRGSSSHLDPYYNLTGRLTRRTDTYAFGVVMFEVLCWRPAFDGELTLQQQMLAKWAQTCFENKTLDTLIDRRLKRQASRDCLHEFAGIANSCLLDEPNDRPKMSKVVELLISMVRKYQLASILSTKESENGTSCSSSTRSRR